MAVSRPYFVPGQLQFITSSVYRRRKLFESPRLRGVFVDTLRQLRQETGFLLIGWVLMPEHFHFPIRPEPAESTSALLQELKKRSAQEILAQQPGQERTVRVTGAVAVVPLQVLLPQRLVPPEYGQPRLIPNETQSCALRQPRVRATRSEEPQAPKRGSAPH